MTAYDMRSSDWSSDVCSSDLDPARRCRVAQYQGPAVSGSRQRVAVIDAGGANLGSVRYALERLGVHPAVVRDADELDGAGRIVLPGVGAAPPARAPLQIGRWSCGESVCPDV